MSTQSVNCDEDPVFNALCFLALQMQIAETDAEPVAAEEFKAVNQKLLSKFKQAAMEVPSSNCGVDLLERARQLLGMNLAAGLFRKPKGVDVPKDFDDEIERAIEDDLDRDSHE